MPTVFRNQCSVSACPSYLRRHIIDFFVSLLGKDDTIFDRGAERNVKTLEEIGTFYGHYDGTPRVLRQEMKLGASGGGNNEKATAAIFAVLGLKCVPPLQFESRI